MFVGIIIMHIKIVLHTHLIFILKIYSVGMLVVTHIDNNFLYLLYYLCIYVVHNTHLYSVTYGKWKVINVFVLNCCGGNGCVWVKVLIFIFFVNVFIQLPNDSVSFLFIFFSIECHILPYINVGVMNSQEVD